MILPLLEVRGGHVVDDRIRDVERIDAAEWSRGVGLRVVVGHGTVF